ncbi:MAG: hypothetical protein KC561_21050, partial [Myxococcales bacterium]|nr:hypothetical protein [Myxococcales bacterium]
MKASPKILDPEEERRWQSVTDRSREADGQFVYAVQTTGIYCRPTCPSRRPHRRNVVFFDGPLSAELAGFRACLRCKPQGDDEAVSMVREVF